MNRTIMQSQLGGHLYKQPCHVASFGGAAANQTQRGDFFGQQQPAVVPEVVPCSYELMNVQHFDWLVLLFDFS